jgi:hypothetical protein
VRKSWKPKGVNRTRSQVSPCKTSGGQSGTGTGFSPSTGDIPLSVSVPPWFFSEHLRHPPVSVSHPVVFLRALETSPCQCQSRRALQGRRVLSHRQHYSINRSLTHYVACRSQTPFAVTHNREVFCSSYNTCLFSAGISILEAPPRERNV